MKEVGKLSTFVLIPGAWHGAWCYEKVTPILEQNGHTVIAVDLPGLGSDTTPISDISLKSYTDKIGTVINQAEEPVILVGHSMGGLAISQSAEYYPEKVKSLVYLTAFLLRDGETMLDYIQVDSDSIVSPNLVFSEDGSSVIVKEEKLIDSFYAKCDQSDIQNIKQRLKPQASCIFSTQLRISNERYGQIPRYYIECLQDKAISIKIQRAMQAATPCHRVFAIDTDHSPFYSAHQELSSILMTIA
jgi:pimeloyl-ACP methyl ester carboxylesterase